MHVPQLTEHVGIAEYIENARGLVVGQLRFVKVGCARKKHTGLGVHANRIRPFIVVGALEKRLSRSRTFRHGSILFLCSSSENHRAIAVLSCVSPGGCSAHASLTLCGRTRLSAIPFPLLRQSLALPPCNGRSHNDLHKSESCV